MHFKEFLHTGILQKGAVYQETAQKSHSTNMISLPHHWNQTPSLLTNAQLGYWAIPHTANGPLHTQSQVCRALYSTTHYVYTCYHRYDTNYLTQKQTRLSYIWLQNHMSCDALIRVEGSDICTLNRAWQQPEAPQAHNALRK